MTKNVHPQLPYFLLDEKKLVENLELLKSVKEKAGVQIILAFKAYALWQSFPLIRKYLDGATSSSIWEALLCNEEFGALSHTYSPILLPEDVEQLCKLSSHLTFNSLSEYHRYKSYVKNYSVSAGLRVNPEFSVVETDLYNPAKRGSRLGVPADVLEQTGLPEGIEGLHFHTLCESSAEDLLNTLDAFELKFGKYLSQLSWVNMGGGHMITKKGYNIDLLVNGLIEFREKYDVDIILEPGAAVVWQCGDLYCRVLDIVENGGIKTALLDVSFTAHMPDTLEMPYRPEVVGSTINGAYRYELGGSSCLAGDFLEEYAFDKPLNVGDVLILKHMIEYTMVKTTTFNGVKHPSICWKKMNGSVELVRKFEYLDFKNRLG